MKIADVTTAVVINYQTPDLLEQAVRSFHERYPEVPVLIVDNGSKDHSLDAIERLERDYPNAVSQLRLPENRYHGPAMHEALERLDTRYVYFFDSDTVTRRTGFLEPMVDRLESTENAYGAGRVLTVDKRGFPAETGTPILWAPYMLITRSIYHHLPPFEHHGVPVLSNMRAAEEEGYRLISFPVEEFVDHLGQGTASRYGYGLGFKSRLDRLMHKIGINRLLQKLGI